MKFKIDWIFGLMLLLMAQGLSAAAADPALSQKWVSYGQKVFAQRDYVKAQTAFSNAARADSRNAAAWKGLGTTLYMRGDKVNALKYYKYALALNPADSGLAAFVSKLGGAATTQASPLALANREYAARQYAAAVGHYQQAVNQNPTDARAWQGLGNARYAQNDRPGAMTAYNKALELNPTNVALRNFVDKAGGGGQTAAGGETVWGQALWRSALLPGWGQVFNGQSTKGYIIGGAELVLLGTVYYSFNAGGEARDRYMAIKDPAGDFDTPYKEWSTWADVNHYAYFAFGAVYLYNLADAVFFAKPKSAYQASLPPSSEIASLDLKLNAMGTPMLQTKLLEF